jgi:hypothetical protein
MGTGNAWPVLISESHPFYDASRPGDLSNAAYSLERADQPTGKIIFDAGYGVIPFLINNGNEVPEAVILTHPHLDHTVSLDWITHSYFKKYNKKKKLPLYCSLRCYQTVIQSFPQLKDKLEFQELFPAEKTVIKELNEISITAYPLYHGNPAVGANMIKIDIEEVPQFLLTGDILCPMLRETDYQDLIDIPFLIVDGNNRFPYPNSNHWSIVPYGPDGNSPGEYLENFRGILSPSEFLSTHLLPFTHRNYLNYFDQWLKDMNPAKIELSILDFCNRISPGKTYIVHYSGGEDEKYYGQGKLGKEDLENWTRQHAGKLTDFAIPGRGDSINLSEND